ncbi:MAG: chemotaxis protein CheB [Myxococcota bacterium]
MKVRVVAVDDSSLCRWALREVLEADGDVEVVGEAEDGPTALRMVRELRPNLVTMDLQMPGMDGLACIEEIMATSPVPILVVTSEPAGPGSSALFEAVRRGALDVAEKPPGGDAAAAAALRVRVRQLAHVPVIRHLRRAARTLATPRDAHVDTPPRPTRVGPRPLVVGIGASAGGPAAVASVLAGLPADFAATVALVQHLAAGFTAPFARFLQSRTALRIRALSAREVVPLQPGVVLLPAEGFHLQALPNGSFSSVEGPPVDGHRPAVTALFRSLAEVYGAGACGVLLTGIGQDGAVGLKALRDRGGVTLVQDRESSAVFGMPHAAVELGAASRVLGLDEMPGALRELVGGRPHHGSG